MEDTKNAHILELIDVDIVKSGLTLLDSINLSITAGEFVYLVGRTGSGKSSLLKAIYGEMNFSRGTGTVCGFDIEKHTANNNVLLRRKLGMIFQEFRLFEAWSVLKNLEFVLKATGWKDSSERLIRIKETLNFVGLSDKLDQRVSFLSGGEQQRLAIGRALLNRPELIVADEPTGNLDPQTSDEIMYLLTNVNKEHNTAVLFATHDYRLIEKFPNRVMRCENKALQEVSLA